MPVNPTTTYTGNKVDPMDASVLMGNFEPQLDVAAGTLLARVTAASQSQIQTINFSGGGDVPTGGTFRLSIPGIDGGTYYASLTNLGTSTYDADLDYNISNADLKIAIENMLEDAGYVGATVTIGGGACPVDATVTFGGSAVYKEMPAMTADGTNLTSSGTATLSNSITTHGWKKGDWTTYNNTDTYSKGTGVARGIAQYDFRTDYFGRVVFTSNGSSPQNRVYQQTAPLWTQGDFLCSKLTGLDSGAITDLGKLIGAAESTDTGAILRVL